MSKNKWFLNGGRGSGRTIRLLCEAYENKIIKLEKENAELKEKNKWYSEQVCNKECAEVWGELTKATEIIKKLYAVYYDPCVTESDLKYRDELFAEIKQFISEVEK